MKLLLISTLFTISLLAQTGPPVVLYAVPPATVTPPISPEIDFPKMGMIFHRFTTDTVVSMTLTYSDGTSQVNLVLLVGTGITPEIIWKSGAYVSLKKGVTVSKMVYTIMSPGTPQDGGIAK